MRNHMRSLTTVFKELAQSFVLQFGNRCGDHWVSHCQIVAFFEEELHSLTETSLFSCTVYYNLFGSMGIVLPIKHLQLFLLPVRTSGSDLSSGAKGDIPEVQKTQEFHAFVGKPKLSCCMDISDNTFWISFGSWDNWLYGFICQMRSLARERLRSETTCTHLRPRTPGASVWEGSKD